MNKCKCTPLSIGRVRRGGGVRIRGGVSIRQSYSDFNERGNNLTGVENGHNTGLYTHTHKHKTVILALHNNKSLSDELMAYCRMRHIKGSLVENIINFELIHFNQLQLNIGRS